MNRITALLLLLAVFATPALADDETRPVAQVPLLALADGPHDDIRALLDTYWQAYYQTGTEDSFNRDDLRVGRIDLNGDGREELVLMITAPAWEAEQGKPFVVAQWRAQKWAAIGWGWGDEDTVFATTEILGGWHSIDGGHMLLRWNGTAYQPEDKAPEAPVIP